MARVTRETLVLRHDFTNDERLIMGSELGAAYNRIAEIEAEETVVKAQLKERKSQVEMTIGTLSRNLTNGFTMENVVCELSWDQPNVGEVSYVRTDNGEIVRVRAMTEAERQMELSLEPPKDETAVEASVVASGEAVEEFFENATGENLAAKYDHDEEEDEPDEEEDDEDQSDEEYDPDLGGIPEPAEPDEPIPGAVVTKRGRGRPKGSKNSSASV